MRLHPIRSAAVALICLPALADTITIDGQTHTDVLVRETDAMIYVQFPTGELRSIPKSADTVTNIEMSNDPAQRDRLQEAWRAARAAENGKPLHAPNATREERYPLAVAAIRDAVAQSNEPIILRLTGTKKTASANETPTIPAELVVNDQTFVMNLNRERLALALRAYAPEQSLDAAVRNGTIHLTGDARANAANEPLQTRHYNVANASGTLPKVTIQNPGGAGGGFQGGAGGFQGGAAGGFQGGAGGFGGGNLGGPQIFNISQLFFTINDLQVGETPNPIAAMYGVP